MVNRKIPPEAATPQGKRRKKKFIFSLIMMIPFCAAMYFLYYKDRAETNKTEVKLGDIPVAVEKEMATTKQEAAERQQQENIQSGCVRSLWETAFSLIGEKDVPEEDKPVVQDNIERSRQTYREVSRQVGTFHAKPKADPEIEKLKKQIEQMNGLLEQRTDNRAGQTDVLERSYQLAAKYLNTPEAPESAATKPAQASPESTKSV